MNLLVTYLYDEESEGWSFRVPSLNVIGGADTRAEAEEKVREAILFALEGDGDRTELLPDEEIGYVHVTLDKAVAAQSA